MKRLILLSPLFLVCLFFSGCDVQQGAAPPPMTQLQVRQIQTREYETTDVKMVMKAMLNVLQDEAFIVKNADTGLGLLSASKDIDIENSKEKFWASFLEERPTWKKLASVEISANISEFGDKTRVRVNFQKRVMNNLGSVVNVEQILDSGYYEDFFSKVSKGVFIQNEEI